MMLPSWIFVGLAAAGGTAAAASVSLNVSAVTSGLIESDSTTTYYSNASPLLISNDGGASTGGFHVFNVDGESPLEAEKDVFAGRTKLVQTIYDIHGHDYLVSISQTTSILSLYSLPDVKLVEDVSFNLLGDWSALCSWKSRSANTYMYLFGKGEAVQILIRQHEGKIEMVEVREMLNCNWDGIDEDFRSKHSIFPPSSPAVPCPTMSLECF